MVHHFLFLFLGSVVPSLVVNARSVLVEGLLQVVSQYGLELEASHRNWQVDQTRRGTQLLWPASFWTVLPHSDAERYGTPHHLQLRMSIKNCFVHN
jgi:hypothetical protein